MPALLSLANCGGDACVTARRAVASDVAMSEPLLDESAHRLERRRQPGRVGAAGLRHVGTPAALAADLLRDVVDQLARLDLADEVAGDAGDQRHLSVGH